MKRQGELDDERYCSCGALLESDDHLFQCPKRPQFQRRILALIDESKPKIAPFLRQILYNGIRQHICKYENSNENDNDKTNTNSTEKPEKYEDALNNIRIVNFKREQSKFCITDDINETSDSEIESITEVADESITEVLDGKQKYFERINTNSTFGVFLAWVSSPAECIKVNNKYSKSDLFILTHSLFNFEVFDFFFLLV